MEKIIYDIKRVEQADRFDCVQASGVSFLSHYDVQKTLQEIKKEVPVFINSKGKELGTAIGHIAKYFLQQGFDVTLHTSDIEIFDQSWKDLSSEELASKILERQSHLKHALYEHDALSVICDGFVQFLKEGGNIVFPVVDEVYMYELLKKGPIYATLNYQFAFEQPRYLDSGEGDSILGSLSTHALLIIGCDNGRLCLLDPDGESEAFRWVNANRVVGAYYLADLHLDPVLITLERRS